MRAQKIKGRPAIRQSRDDRLYLSGWKRCPLTLKENPTNYRDLVVLLHQNKEHVLAKE